MELDSTILIDLSPSGLVEAAVNNLYGLFESFERVPGADFARGPGWSRWRTQVPYPWFNGVTSDGLLHSDTQEIIHSNLDYFHSHGVYSITWWLWPGSESEGLGHRLLSNGFLYTPGPPGMAADLLALNEPAVEPQGLRIQTVEDLPALRTWVDVFLRGYGLPLEWGAGYYEMVAGLGLDLPLRNYLGWLDGEPVAAGTLFLYAGVAGVYNIAVLPDARGRGLGAALSMAPLRDARQLGYRVGVLQSSTKGFPVYRRLGFQKVCDMAYYYHNYQPEA